MHSLGDRDGGAPDQVRVTRLVVHPAARREFDAALEWSKVTFGARTAARLRRRFERAGEMLMREPALGTLDVVALRKHPLGRFPYTLVYRVQGQTITVFALAHQSRKPGYWLGR